MFGGFQHGGVPCGQGTDERLEGQGKGVVPGADDQHAPPRLRNDFRLARTLRQGNRHPLGAHPSAQVPEGQFQFLTQGHHFEEGLGGRLPQICSEGLKHLLFMVLHQRHEALELKLSPGQRAGFATANTVLHQADLVDGQRHGADVLA